MAHETIKGIIERCYEEGEEITWEMIGAVHREGKLIGTHNLHIMMTMTGTGVEDVKEHFHKDRLRGKKAPFELVILD